MRIDHQETRPMSQKGKNWNHRNDVMGCARYYDWKHIRQIGDRKWKLKT